MASFSKMAVFPVGYFRATSSWLLRNRRSVAARIRAINAELERIGFVTVTYRTEEKDGSIWATEDRTGFAVTKNSSLERLCRAYIANGGNPLDISPFLHPDGTEVISENPDGTANVKETYPYGGIIAPISANPNEPLPKEGSTTGFESDRGGFIRSDGYDPGRQGGRKSRGDYDSDTIVRYLYQIRSWADQDIKERVQDIEARIIKLCDLQEQLLTERDEVLVQAFGGDNVLSGVGPLDEDRFPGELRVQALIQDMYVMLYRTDEDGAVGSFRGNDNIGFLKFTFDDKPSELRFPLG